MRSGDGGWQASHYELWEDWRAGLYADSFRPTIITASRILLAAPKAFTVALDEAIEAWPTAAAHNLSNLHKNHRPWCGRAANTWQHGATLHEVGSAWGLLTEAQRQAANQVADSATQIWRSSHRLGQMVLL